MLTTGSQGEPLSALRRMAHGEHPNVKLHSGDTIIFSATPIPGNERAVNETVDRLYQIGATVITARDAAVHASGHGWTEELKLMINLTNPRYVMPIHGDHKRLHLHAKLAESVGIDATHYLVLATVVSAAMAGLGGWLYAHYTRFVSPEVFLFSYTVTMVIMVVAGGKGTLAGPVVGAALFTVLPEALREATSWQWQMLAYGVILMLVLYLLPRGIVPALSAWAPRRTGAPGASTAPPARESA
jgi:hypothetical protein